MKNEINFKIGDRVKWSGEYLKYINGWDSKKAIIFINSERKINPDWDFEKFIQNNTVPIKKKGVGKIKNIGYDDLFKEVIITLHNRKIFTNEELKKCNETI